ncbi:M20/M25/M40 family metallo-hydrolase [Sphingomonas sp. G124]|uniref:M20/M25/M40 family metallo-hydrolase n=1 Tax=Sphingomonas cremea TaxID=2904799 RepID=A0A9X1QK60_9SPHN|nr:M20/M25/M40 family metallo-hydrolase [Sphingomonas cremea]MCF2514595.1 M20/M25/M40 family metallo-hydrolase [Sphingomonas cremea]
MPQFLRFAVGAALAATTVSLAAQQNADQVQSRQIFAKVVEFRTSQGNAQVPAMANYLEAMLRDAGIASDNIAKLPKGETVGMLVRIPGTDRNAKPILFSAHMDVVDARPEDWKRDPYKLIEENGYFYGRGTLDNKAGVVALMSTILRLHKEGVKPRRTLVFAFVGDEETGLDEADGTTRQIAAHPWVKDAEYAINTDAGGGILAPDGKPIIYLVQGAEKTFATFQLTATNPGGHSSRPRADNAIYDLAKAVTRVGEYRFPVMSNELTRAYLGAVGKVTPGPAGEALRRFAANPADSAAADAIWGDPEFVGTTRTTCVATMLSAGHAENALPQKATATVNCRIFPGVTVDDVRQQLSNVVADPKIAVTVVGAPFASPVSELRPDIERAIAQSIHKPYPGVALSPYLESGGTDGMVYRTVGIPTWASSGVFIKPDEMFAHGLDERIPAKSFYDGIEHIYDLARTLGGA